MAVFFGQCCKSSVYSLAGENGSGPYRVSGARCMYREREREMYYILYNIYVSFGWRGRVWVMQGLQVGCAWRAVRVGVGRLRATRGQRWVFDCSIPGCLQGERWHCYSTDAHPVGDTSVTRLWSTSRAAHDTAPPRHSKRVIACTPHPAASRAGPHATPPPSALYACQSTLPVQRADHDEEDVL